jgi:hypothetical protein
VPSTEDAEVMLINSIGETMAEVVEFDGIIHIGANQSGDFAGV